MLSHKVLLFFTSHVSRRAIARVLSTFLCALLVVIRPFSHFGGSTAFLVLSLKELVFSVQDDLAQQLELTVLNITGALVGIGVSTLAKYLATLPQEGSAVSRLIPALFLVTISFVAGWLKSRLPRLHLSTRISCFLAIWMLTSNAGIHDSALADAGNFLWITLTAAVVCLFSSFLLLHWASTHFVEEVAATLSSLHQCLSLSIDNAFSPLSSSTATKLKAMHSDLVHKSVNLNELYSRAAFELRVGRVGVKSIKPLIGIIEHLRRELAWGTYAPRLMSTTSKNHVTAPVFETTALELGKAILESLSATEKVVIGTFIGATLTRKSFQSEKDAITSAETKLFDTRYAAEDELHKLICDAGTHPDLSYQQFRFENEIPYHCLFVTSLLQMANDVSHILQMAHMLINYYEKLPLRLWHPRFSLQWLGVAPRTFVLDELGTHLAQDTIDADTALSAEEARQGLAASDESHSLHDDIHDQSNRAEGSYFPSIEEKGQKKSFSPQSCAQRLPLKLRRLWNHPQVLRVRLCMSKLARDAKHSSHLRHALKNAAGVALLSTPAFFPQGSAGLRWFTLVHGQWMIISYVWVLETNTGATWRVGYLRLLGTIIGALYAYIMWLICHRNPYGLVTMVTAADIPITWIIIHSNIPSLGVVASVTLPPIVLSQYLSLATNISTLDLAVYRGAMIGIGIVAALLMNSLVFPRHSRVLFLNHTSRSLGLLSHLYLNLSRDLFHNSYTDMRHDKHKTLKLELQIRNALYRLSSLMASMRDELSLVPKPVHHYRQVVLKLQKVLDLMAGLRKIREKIPRNITVFPVLKERREFVSCVCISLFACEHVFRARQPLPQFLPSSRQALDVLTNQIESRIQHALEEDKSLVGVSLAYSLAEVELMKDMVDTIEDLLELCRQLFGTSTWLTQSWSGVYTDDGPGTPGDSWYGALGRDHGVMRAQHIFAS